MLNFRRMVSLTLALSFLIMTVTGVLSFALPYSRVTATIHTVFGTVFILVAALHLVNNYKSLKSYIAGKK